MQDQIDKLLKYNSCQNSTTKLHTPNNDSKNIQIEPEITLESPSMSSLAPSLMDENII